MTHAPVTYQAGALLVSQPPTPRTEPRSMMLGRCAQSTVESIRERLDTRQRRKVSKWNFGAIESYSPGQLALGATMSASGT